MWALLDQLRYAWSIVPKDIVMLLADSCQRVWVSTQMVITVADGRAAGVVAGKDEGLDVVDCISPKLGVKRFSPFGRAAFLFHKRIKGEIDYSLRLSTFLHSSKAYIKFS